MSDQRARKIHPAIAHYEKTGSTTAEIRGYIGADHEGTTRIYAKRDGSRWIEIPKNHVVDIIPDTSEEGRVTVLVSADAKPTLYDSASQTANALSAVFRAGRRRLPTTTNRYNPVLATTVLQVRSKYFNFSDTLAWDSVVQATSDISFEDCLNWLEARPPPIPF
jgi:hypothetical protein